MIYIYTGIYIYIYIFIFVTKHPSSFDCTKIRTYIPMSEGFEVTNLTTGVTGAELELARNGRILQ